MKPRALLPEESWSVLRSARALRLPALLEAETARAMAERVLAARAQWTEDFGGAQFSLGRAFYTHLETGRERHYFKDAQKADARVEAVLPGMQAGVRALVAALVGEPVAPRPGFCGPGVHVFLPGCEVAKKGGSVHFDLEGLRDDAERGGAALSLVIMLRPAESRGGLRVFPGRFSGSVHACAAESKAPFETLDYAAGDAIVFESQRLHQIEPFAGSSPRVSITAHALRRPEGLWHVWF